LLVTRRVVVVTSFVVVVITLVFVVVSILASVVKTDILGGVASIIGGYSYERNIRRGQWSSKNLRQQKGGTSYKEAVVISHVVTTDSVLIILNRQVK
jgi:hypothetical protein